MTLKNLIKYNKAVFMTGGTFTKGWMVTMPIFIGYIIFNTVQTPAWPMALFASAFSIAYPFRNYYMVNRYITIPQPLDKVKIVDEFKDYLNKL